MNHGNNDPTTAQFSGRTSSAPTWSTATQCVDLVGQIRSSVFIPGVAATPEWTGNITGSYLVGDFTGAVLMRYIGGAKLDKRWVDDPERAGLLHREWRDQQRHAWTTTRSSPTPGST